MSENKQNTEDVNKNEEQVSAETDAHVTEPTLGESEAGDVKVEQEDEVRSEMSEDDSSDEDELSPDDLLGDVRRSLIEDSAEKEQADQSKWWKRIGRGGGRKQDVGEAEPEPVEQASVEPKVTEDVDTSGEQDDEYVEQIDELIDLLEEDGTDDSVEMQQPVTQFEEKPAPQVEEEKVDLQELKKRAFSSGPTDKKEEDLSEVRSIALDDGEEVFIEVETKAADPMQERLAEFENALRPYRRYFYFGFIFISIAMVLLVSASMYRLWLNQRPTPTPEAVSSLPYPVQLVMPGDFRFSLGKGSLQPDGRWEPTGPEWLEGTEICRWIAIPYNRQLEAIVRTFTKDDQLELVMSNNDRLTYNVYSINEMSIADMQKLDASTPCVLLVLAQPDTDKRWVVQAIP